MNKLQEKLALKQAAKAIDAEFSPGNAKHRTGATWRQWEWIGPQGITVDGVTHFPTTDNGHALHLAVKLSMDIFIHQISVVVVWDEIRTTEACSGKTEDRERATRLAILKTAAAIGRRRLRGK